MFHSFNIVNRHLYGLLYPLHKFPGIKSGPFRRKGIHAHGQQVGRKKLKDPATLPEKCMKHTRFCKDAGKIPHIQFSVEYIFFSPNALRSKLLTTPGTYILFPHFSRICLTCSGSRACSATGSVTSHCGVTDLIPLVMFPSFSQVPQVRRAGISNHIYSGSFLPVSSYGENRQLP